MTDLRRFEVYHVSFNKKSDDYRQEVVQARIMKFLLTLLVLSFGCNEKLKEPSTSFRNECTTKEDRAMLSEFIIRCAEAANPKSDEEGEDLVAECLRTGERVHCPLVEKIWKDHGWEPKLSPFSPHTRMEQRLEPPRKDQ